MAQDGAPPPGEGWDDALLDAWRSEAGYAGVHYLDILPGKPKLAIDLSGAVQLILDGRMGNPLLHRGKALLDEEAAIRAEAAVSETADAAEQRFWAHHRDVLEWYDAVVAAVWVSPPNPPWCRIADLPAAGRPRGQFCIHDIQPPARRRMLVDLVIAGADGLASFREQSAVLAVAQDGGSLRPAAEQLPDSGPPAPPAVLVRPGDLAGGQPGGPEGAGAPSGLYAIPWEPDADGGADPLGA